MWFAKLIGVMINQVISIHLKSEEGEIQCGIQ